MNTVTSQHAKRSDRLLAALDDYSQIVIVTHDNPDPDAIAAGWAVQVLIREKLGLNARLIGGGEVVRAENRHMLRLLGPNLELLPELTLTDETAAILVDCGFEAVNHLLMADPVRPVAIIDHHATSAEPPKMPFVDIRPQIAASATIAAGYLREQKIEPEEKLATALLYAIRTETRGSKTEHSRLDRDIIGWLTPRANPTWLAEIENAPLTRSYFADLALALQNTFLYDDAAFCLLPQAQGPEVVGEMADLLIRCESVRRVFCAAAWDGEILLSARTEPGGEDASQLLRKTIEGIGRAGGHTHRAGGKIPHVTSGRITETLEDDLRERWLAACHINRDRGTRLIAKQDIVKNL